MNGIYDYTVILTYLSVFSAGLGILVSLTGGGHPYIGVFFLMLCGLFDAFDGKVARTKKNRSDYAKRFGIQIDSLTDILSFGVLPMSVGTALIRVSPLLKEFFTSSIENSKEFVNALVLYAVMLLYLLAALVRLAHYNVTEEIRQDTEEGNRKYFEGLPVTSSAIVFPTVLLIQYLTENDITILFFIVMLAMAFAFVSKFKIPKPGTRGILIMVGIGLIEFIALLIAIR